MQTGIGYAAGWVSLDLDTADALIAKAPVPA